MLSLATEYIRNENACLTISQNEIRTIIENYCGNQPLSELERGVFSRFKLRSTFPNSSKQNIQENIQNIRLQVITWYYLVVIKKKDEFFNSDDFINQAYAILTKPGVVLDEEFDLHNMEKILKESMMF